MPSTVKRCAVAAVLALVATLPDAPRLHTSLDGLALIGGLEGCRLAPYRCTAGVWTNGIGHTAAVVPARHITPRVAAVNLVADVMRVEARLAPCIPATLPQPVYDAVVSFAFNVGPEAACHSTLAVYLNRHRWAQACNELPRWVYVNGVASPGLAARRAREQAYCLKGAQ